jgi:putative ABC transport system substrate-binding protein
VRLGILGPAEEPRFSEVVGGLRQGLHDLGYAAQAIEILEGRVARGDEASARAVVEGFIQQRVQGLFVLGSQLVRQARQVSAELPIVHITPGDPVEQGLAASLAHPGGHTTAMTFEYPELAGKRLELLREMLPGLRRVLVFYDTRDASPRQAMRVARAAAPQLGLTLVERETRNAEELARGLEALTEAEAVLVMPGGFPTGHYEKIIRVAHAQRAPTMVHARTASTMEAFASYGTSEVDVARQAARLVDKVLKGTKAGDIPVERPMRLEFVLNLKAVQQLGLTLPSGILTLVDKIID